MTYYQLQGQQVVGIPLYRSDEIVGFALVDLEDAQKVLSISNKWKMNTQGYAYCRKGSEPDRVLILMHRVIMDCPDSMVDHANRNRIDNRRVNLRLATPSQNVINRDWSGKNKTGFIGIVQQRDGRYIARCHHGKDRVYLGRFKDPVEAARAYDMAARKYHGEFAQLNFPS